VGAEPLTDMARPLRPQVEDGIYHVYNRGNAREPILDRDDDRVDFIRKFKAVLALCDWLCLSYCLLDNHYHLVIRTPVANLARGMRQLNSTYAQAFNRRRDRPGHVFQGRYGARLIQRDEHLLATLKYVALNPVEAGLCERAEDWRWSGHAALLGLTGSGVVDVPATLALLDEQPDTARAIYRDATATEPRSNMPAARGDVVLGDREFAMAAIGRTGRLSREIPLRQRLAWRPDLDVLLAEGRAGVLSAYHSYGYSQREIADHLGCHYSTVSRYLSADA
jgi:REP-associated tyrosine transposase